MSQAGRIVYSIISILTLAAVALIYARPFLSMNQKLQNQYSGPYSVIGSHLKTLVPLLIGLLLLGTIVYMIVGPIQQERSAQRRKP